MEEIFVPGIALPCCRLPQKFPDGKIDYIGLMVCNSCGRRYMLTRKAGVLRVQPIDKGDANG